VGSCFKVFIVRSSMVLSKINFDTWFMIYIFFIFQTTWWYQFFLSVLHACRMLRWRREAHAWKHTLVVPLCQTKHTLATTYAQTAAVFGDKLFFSSQLTPRSVRRCPIEGALVVHVPRLISLVVNSSSLEVNVVLTHINTVG
jgi:hypothetical protein